ncbi:MAG: hypothetical protein ACSHYB_11970 [Roseibacillus sp.]
MRALAMVSTLLLLGVSSTNALVLARSGKLDPTLTAQVKSWKEGLDTSAIVLIHTPFGVPASGVLLEGGTHILTAAHVTNCLRPEQLKNGLVTFPNAQNQRRHWKSIQLHPSGTTAPLRKIWDAALIELDQPIPAHEVSGLQISTQPINAGDLIALTGFGHRGTGQLGAIESSGTFTIGFNHFEKSLSPGQCLDFRLPPGDWPIWIYHFDSADTLGPHEAHFASGDSGGAGLILDQQGRTRLVSLNCARHRGHRDQDHRLNGSFGEVGLSLEVHALRPWLKEILHKTSDEQIKETKNKHKQ